MRELLVIAMMLACALAVAAQTSLEGSEKKIPVVTKVDGGGLRSAIAPKGRPVLVNFWATFCDPCRDEFPDLVKIAADYKDRVDVVTVSLDDVAEIDRDVPKFLASMGAYMPAYLLSTPDEDSLINSISKEWGGGLPFTVVYDASGKMTYQKLGKFKPAVVRGFLDRLFLEAPVEP